MTAATRPNSTHDEDEALRRMLDTPAKPLKEPVKKKPPPKRPPSRNPWG